ncbi:MAG: HAD-IA family hydrolase [Paracoccus sp. (in: a-proteobacteria)]|nr:HAD-IA family hydrolase [Paracoccus sp. (in: a-proteobacteria)]
MKLVVFDVDGTLIDSQALILAATGAAFQAQGLPPPARGAVLSIVGLSLPLAMARLAPGLDEAGCQALTQAYRAAFLGGRLADEPPLYPGARACLDALAARDDLALAVATGKSRRGLEAALDQHGLRGHFVSLRSADSHPSKPHPEMLLTACADAGVAPGDAVMVGDTEFDMDMARAAGTSAIGVAWGYHPAQALAAMGVPVARDFAGLHAIINEWAA